MKVLPFVLAAVCAVVAIILTMAVANPANTQQTVTSAAPGVGAIEGVRDADDLGCITLLGLDFDLRCTLHDRLHDTRLYGH